MIALGPAALGIALALLAALLLRLLDGRAPGADGAFAAFAWLALLPLAALVVWPQETTLARAGLAAGLAVALFARDREDLAQSEVALKLAWTLGGALALAWAADSLLASAAGSAVAREQWPALALQLDPYALWMSALALALLAAVVLLGAAPFHFWLADVVQGARAWQAPIVAAGLAAAGAELLARRLDGIDRFAAGAALARAALGLAAVLARVAGAATLAVQRRPERRVGTLASLQGALVIAALAADPGARPFASAGAGALSRWAVHLALALSGAGALARFVPAESRASEGAAALFRRHPWSALAGSWSLLSLAGAPGTPGATWWLAVARELAARHRTGLLLALAFAWLTSFAVAVREIRNAFGSPEPASPLPRETPLAARAALWCAAAGLAALAWWSWPA